MTCPRTGLERGCPCPLHDPGRVRPAPRKRPEGEWNGSEDDEARAYEDRFDGLDEGGR